MCAPYEVQSFGFEHSADLSTALQAVRANSCDWDLDLAGGERFYAVTVPLPGVMEVVLDSDDGVKAFLFDRANDDACVAHGGAFETSVNPGQYWLVVDSDRRVVGERKYDLAVDFAPSVAADDVNEPNDTLEQGADNAWMELPWGDPQTVRGVLVPTSRVDWWAVQVDAEMTTYIELEAQPGLRLEVFDDDEQPVQVTPGAELWGTAVDSGNDYEMIYVKVSLDADAPVDSVVDYVLRLESEYTEWWD